MREEDSLTRDGRMNAGAVGEHCGFVGGIVQMNLAFNPDVRAEMDVAVDVQSVALEQRWGALGKTDLEIGDVPEKAGIESDIGRRGKALVVESHLMFGAQGVEIGADGEQIVGGLDGGEAEARHDEGGGLIEASDG